MTVLRRNYQRLADEFSTQQAIVTELKAHHERAEELRVQFEEEKKEIVVKLENEIIKHKKEITDFKVKVRRITQQMSRTSYANHNVLRQMT